MDKQFQLVFRGETLEGCDAAAVKREIGEQLKLNAARLDHLFSGRRVVLRRGVDAERAHRHVRQFAKLGARLYIEPDGEAPPEPPQRAGPLAQPATMIMPPPAPRPPPPLQLQPAGPPAAPPRDDLATHPMPLATDLSLVPTAAPAADPADSITCPHCGEVQPKAVFCRACTTNMPMGIAARLEAEEKLRAAPRRDTAPTRAVPSGQIRFQAGAGLAEQAPSLLGFGFRGRISRRGYAQASAVTFLIAYLLLLFVMKQPSLGRIALGALLGLPLAAYGARLCVLRCHDTDRSGWWALLLAVPLLGLLAALALAWVPSTEGDNRYGEMPDEGSKTLTTLVTGSCALVIALALRPALQAAEQEEAVAQAAAGTARPALDPAADRAFHVEYQASPGHKAFAVAPGVFAWKGSAGSADEAEEAALAACEEQRQAATVACELVNLDGEWMGRWAPPLSR